MADHRLVSLRDAFLTGLLLVAPLVVTIWALRLLIGFVGGSITPLFLPYLPDVLTQLPNLVWDVTTTVIVLGLIAALGFFSRLLLGRYVGALAERLIQGIPGIGSFYNSVKQFIATLGAKDRAQFSKVVLVQFPRAGAYTIGFVTNTGRAELHRHFATDHWAVFVPTCPSPINGFFMYVPVAELIELDVSVGDGMKTVISCGAVPPTWSDPAAAKAALAAPGPAAGA